MAKEQTILLLGGTGRTGSKVLRQLLDRGQRVRAIVRSRGKVPPDLAGKPGLTLVEASLLDLSEQELGLHLQGCDAVICCLGHVISLRGIFGPPRDLVARAVERLGRGIAALRPAKPVKLILLSSVSVRRPDGLDRRWSLPEKCLMGVLCALLPPAKDNQVAAEGLLQGLGVDPTCLEWVAVRPDTLLEGEACPYTLHDSFVNSLFSPGSTRMANVAHFMAELVTDPGTWARWRSKLPVIVDEPRG